jgi:hypothetical protein
MTWAVRSEVAHGQNCFVMQLLIDERREIVQEEALGRGDTEKGRRRN